MTQRSGAKQVLIVDDDDEIREGLGDILSYEGFAIETACNGREALLRLQSGPPPSIILLDLMMPVMSGIEFRSEQVKDPALRGIPVVVVSAGDDSDRHARDMGVEGFIRKPIDIEKLLSTIRAHC